MTLGDIGIKPPRQTVNLRMRKYKTRNIIDLVNEVLKSDADDTEVFARRFSSDKAGMRAIFDFVDHNFIYQEDPESNQWVQTPSYLWSTKQGDCKSYTVFISSVLQNMGIKHIVRYVSYGGSNVTHVYPVALIGGKEVVMDVVYKKQKGAPFGSEKKYTFKKDFIVEGLYKLGTTGTADIHKILGAQEEYLAALENATADIPDSIINEGPGDVTQLTSGQLDRIIWADRYKIWAGQESDSGAAGKMMAAAEAIQKGSIAGIGALQNDSLGKQVQKILRKTANDNKPAFGEFRISVPKIHGAEVAGLKDFFKKIGEALKRAFTKFVNWIFKGAGKMMGPYFLFLFMDKNKVKSKELKRRIAAQEKTFNWIATKGKLDKAKLLGVALNGIKQKTGKTPQEIFKSASGGKVSGFAAVISVVIEAISVVWGVIKKIVGLFKKEKSSDAGKVDQNNMSDPNLLQEEAQLRSDTTKGGGSQSSDSSSSSGGGASAGLAVLAALAAFAMGT